jgi:Domain of unknown function (DUF4920)
MHRASLGFARLALVALLVGCSRAPSSGPDPAAATPSASAGAGASTGASASATAGTLTIGERITSPLVSLADIARDPAKFEGRVIATSGKVTAVCQEMGCWMQLEDASGKAHVRMHGHTFFVPKTASGHLARVQATLVKPAGGADDCEEGKASAKVELDATGVELD